MVQEREPNYIDTVRHSITLLLTTNATIECNKDLAIQSFGLIDSRNQMVLVCPYLGRFARLARNHAAYRSTILLPAT
jgi:hypothetical protein